jgi:hypothetical protein
MVRLNRPCIDPAEHRSIAALLATRCASCNTPACLAPQTHLPRGARR